MKILHINYSESIGGAATAANRLHKALLKNGVDSKMLVCEKKSNDNTVIGPDTKLEKSINLVRPMLDQVPIKFYKSKSKTMFSTAWLTYKSIIKKINQMNSDIVHLHWINNGMLRVEDLAIIKVPIVWSLHDMWAFTGGCHYDEECGGYKNNCGNCKVLNSIKNRDLSLKVFSRKKKTYSKINNLTIVGLSKWLTKSAKKSTLLKNSNVVNLPNLIDTDLYKPLDQNLCRDLFKLPKDKKLVLFGAMGATSDPRKGYSKLKDALDKIDSEVTEFVAFGNTESQISSGLKININFIGRKDDDESLVALYNACDVMVVPSIQENLSNVIMESLACGTPVVAFNIGGNEDMIDHNINGYLARPFDTKDLAEGIEWVLWNSNYLDLSAAARKTVVENFSEKFIVEKYTQLYKQVL